MVQIRNVRTEDVPAIKEAIDSTSLFPSAMLDGMIQNYFQDATTSDIWLTVEHSNLPVAVAYCAPERMTDGTYNLYLIAVHNQYQNTGIGSVLIAYLEKQLGTKGARVLLIETSSLSEYAFTRIFYKKCGYRQAAVIADFYKEGEDKIVFWKKLV